MSIMKNKNWFIHSCMIVMLVCASCAKSGLDEETPKGLASVTIDFDVPASQEMITRSVEDEGQVRTLDVLFFDASGASSVDPVYREKRHLNYVITVELGKVRAVIKDLPLGTYRVVAVANAEATLLDGLSVGDKLSTVKSSLVNSASTTMPESNLLMAGESTKNEVITDGAQVLSTISLVRAVARIDVLCQLRSSLTTPFELTSAEVRNARTQSYLFGQYILSNKDQVAVPAGATIVDYVRPNVTTDFPSYADVDGNILAQLYAYENSSTSSVDNRDETTCLIVGGKFNGSGVTTYYRLDIRNSNGKYVIKRNHRYILTITAVLGPGYGTKEEAENGLMNNIKAEIIEWVEGGSSGIMMEGDKMISVSKTQFDVEMYSTGQVVEMGVIIKNLKTDAFRIEQDGASGEWLEIDNVDPFTTSGDNVYEKKVRFKIRQDNPSPDARTATLKVSAGGAMYLVVKVVQGNSDRIMLNYVMPELGSKAVQSQKVDFSFVNPNQNHLVTGLSWNVESMSDWIEIDTADGKPNSGIGKGSFYINVAAHPVLGYSRRGTVRLTVSEVGDDGKTNYYYRAIQVIQYNIDGSLEYVALEGQEQDAVKIPDKGYSEEHTIIVHSRASVTVQKDGIPVGWEIDFRYVTDGAYILAIKATPVANRTTATEKTLDTYRIGYINFVNNQGKVLRTLLIYQGYVMALPNMAHIWPDHNAADLPAADAVPAWSNPNGLVPRFPDKPLIYELVSHRKKVWLDRNVNAEVSSVVPRTSTVWPDGIVGEAQKAAVSLGSKMYMCASSVFSDSDKANEVRKRMQGACPTGFRTPTLNEFAYTTPTYPLLDDNPTIKYPWVYLTNGEAIFSAFSPTTNPAGEITGASLCYHFVGYSGISRIINGVHIGVYYRCISEK